MKKIIPFLLTFILSFNVGSQTLQTEKPIKIIVPTGAGGGLDLTARIIGKNLSELIKTPVIVENKPGGNGTVAAKFVLGEENDGRTLLFFTPHAYSVNNIFSELRKDVFEWEKELVPLSIVHWSPFLLLVNKKTNIDNLVDLKEKFKGKEITFGSTGVGTPAHIYGEIIFEKLGIKSIHVPYKGWPQLTADILNGSIDVVFALSLGEHIKAGNLTPIISFSEKPPKEFPNIQTMTGNFSEFSNLKMVGSFLLSKKVSDDVRLAMMKNIELASIRSKDELVSRGLIDINEDFTYNEKRMKSMEKLWTNVSEKIKNKK
jgi:tripartite-type tricarboxylate transporter receptor subunit TctC